MPEPVISDVILATFRRATRQAWCKMPVTDSPAMDRESERAGLRAAIAAYLNEHIRDAQTDSRGHIYLSTGCLHGEHGYCQSTGDGRKVPATCKFCAAPCLCWCHAATPASAGEPKATSKAASDLGSVVEPVVPEGPQP